MEVAPRRGPCIPGTDNPAADGHDHRPPRSAVTFLTLATLCVVLWMLAVVSGHALGGLVHLLLLGAGAFALGHRLSRERRSRPEPDLARPSEMQARLALGRERVPAYLRAPTQAPVH